MRFRIYFPPEWHDVVLVSARLPWRRCRINSVTNETFTISTKKVYQNGLLFATTNSLIAPCDHGEG